MSLVWLERARHPDLALLLDLDGTLIPFADHVEEAHLDRAASNLLSALVFARARVVIVSGRKVEHLEAVRVGGEIWWVAEHGAWRRAENDWEGPEKPSEDLGSLIHVLAPFADEPGLSIEHKSLAVCVHWRRISKTHRVETVGHIRDVIHQWLASHPEFERLEGVESLEVRHHSKTKRHAVEWVRQRIPTAHVMAIGDSQTDEDMFAALRPSEVGFIVGSRLPRTTKATCSLLDPTAVRRFLWWIVDVRSGRHEQAPPIQETQ